MIAAELERPPMLCPVPREGRTLEDLLSGAWEDLSANRTASQPSPPNSDALTMPSSSVR